jgi:1-pyrroline-5-carboxylate dehydrogenase
MQLPKFKNEPYTNWAEGNNRKLQEKEIAKLESQFGKEYPNIINGQRVYGGEKFNSLNPSNPKDIVGVFQKGTAGDALNALDAAWKAFAGWSKVPPDKRAALLFKAAKIMRRRRFELNATMVLEVGKSFPEADADTAEAIDFLEFGREMLRYAAIRPAGPATWRRTSLSTFRSASASSSPPGIFHSRSLRE